MNSFTLRNVRLVTRSIAHVLPFYRDILALVPSQPDAKTLDLSFLAGTAPVISFTEDATAAAAGNAAGLFHLALLVPDRPTLAAVLARLIAQRQPIEGLSDHGVSEAIYLSDPDGNGIEIYRDRPRGEWPMRGEKVAMVTRPLDHRGLLRDLPSTTMPAPLATSTLGHLHLRASDLGTTRQFYTGKLGLAVRQDDYPGAVFMAADGYHHHIAANVWGNPGRRPDSKITGLAGFRAGTLRLRENESLVDPDGVLVALEPL